MATAKKVKASDKQEICRKLITLLKKRYKSGGAPSDKPILETMLYAVCLENASEEQADAAFERLRSDFFDLNEVRVSSIRELEPVFEGMTDAEWRGLRVRSVLQYVFEHEYSFEFETLRRLSRDAAQKQLAKINYLTPFVEKYTLQSALSAHLIPVDDIIRGAVVWCGLIDPDASNDDASDALKSSLRKADGPLFGRLFRSLATDPALAKTFERARTHPPADGFDVFTAPERLKKLFAEGDSAVDGHRKKKTKTATKNSVASKSKSNTSAKAASSKTGKASNTKSSAGSQKSDGTKKKKAAKKSPKKISAK